MSRLWPLYERLSRDDEKGREEAQMAADPAYAAMMAECKAEHDALVERAKTDPEAARQLA